MSTSSKDDSDLVRCCPVHQLHDLSFTTLECMLIAECVLTSQFEDPHGELEELCSSIRDKLHYGSCRIRLESASLDGEIAMTSQFCHADSCCCPECQKGGE